MTPAAQMRRAHDGTYRRIAVIAAERVGLQDLHAGVTSKGPEAWVEKLIASLCVVSRSTCATSLASRIPLRVAGGCVLQEAGTQGALCATARPACEFVIMFLSLCFSTNNGAGCVALTAAAGTWLS